jgi:hypothetical protein
MHCVRVVSRFSPTPFARRARLQMLTNFLNLWETQDVCGILNRAAGTNAAS